MYKTLSERKKESMTLLLKQVLGDMIDSRLNSWRSTHTDPTLPSPRTLVATITFLRIGRDQNFVKNRVCSEIDVVHD